MPRFVIMPDRKETVKQQVNPSTSSSGTVQAWPWCMKFAGAVGSSTVVVPNVDSERHTQVPLVKDQHAVSEFGSDRAHEPFGETVGPHRRLHPVPTIGIAGCG